MAYPSPGYTNILQAPGDTIGASTSVERLICPILQKALDDVAGSNTGYLTRAQTGFIDSLLSPVNTAGFQQITTNDGGRARRIELIYPQTMCSQVFTSEQDACNGPNGGREWNSQLIDPAEFDFLGTAVFEISHEDLIALCFMDNQEYKASLIMQAINHLTTELDKALLTQYFNATSYATIGSGPVPIPINLVLNGSTNASMNFGAWSNGLMQYFKNRRFAGKPIIVGAGDVDGIYTFAEIVNAGCCNENGIDISYAGNKMYYFYDIFTDNSVAVPGAVQNGFIAYQPGALQLLTFLKHANGSPFRDTPSNQFIRDTIIDPYTGLEFDFTMIYACEGAWRLTIGLKYRLWGLPDDMYCNDLADPTMNGWTGNAWYQAIP